MPITHEDITELKRVFDDRYVLQSDCNERQEEIQKVLADDDKQIALILQEQKQMRKEQKDGFKFNNWLTAAILGALIVGFVGCYFFVS